MRKALTVFVLTAALAGVLGAVALGLDVIALNPPVTPVPDESSTVLAPMQPETSNPISSVVYLPCTSPQQGLNFPNYWAGRNFDGLIVSAVIRRCDPPRDGEQVRANYVSFLYGDCPAADDEGCAPPIEVQTWSSGERNKASLTAAPFESGVAGTDTFVLGVPATNYEGGKRLEIYHPDATVIVFGDDPARISRFATALVKGPSVLIELTVYGLEFDVACVNDIHYCVAISHLVG